MSRKIFKTGVFGNRGFFALNRGMARSGVKSYHRSMKNYNPLLDSTPLSIYLLRVVIWFIYGSIFYGIFELINFILRHPSDFLFVAFLCSCIAIILSILKR